MVAMEARLIAVAAGLLMTGCVAIPTHTGPAAPPAPGPVATAVPTWNPHVVMAPDPTKNGTPAPGIVGRLYLFGPNIDYPQVGDGGVSVTLYDETHGQHVQLEEWRFDPATLKRLLKQDKIGWGYTLFLPWGTYRPDIGAVKLAVRYDPAKGSPIYASPSPVKLEPTEAAPVAGIGLASALAAGK